MPEQNPYRMTLDELVRSTGHAPGEKTIEVEPAVEVPHDLPMRVTPMTPASEIAAIGQLGMARPSRRPVARRAAVVWLILICIPLIWSIAARFVVR